MSGSLTERNPAPSSHLLIISGPTGVGKSAVAVRLAQRVEGEIINADSIQLYSGFNIGSAKPGPDLRGAAPHHLFDVLDAKVDCDAFAWSRMAEQVIEEIIRRNRIPIVVGGTNFYLRALTRGLPEIPERDEMIRSRLRRIMDRPGGARHLHRFLRRVDPLSAGRIEQADRHRTERALEVYLVSGRPISSFEAPTTATPPKRPYLQFALTLDREVLRERLDQRVERMYAEGLVEEVRGLLSQHHHSVRAMGAIGYREALAVARGEVALAEAIRETKRRTRAYSKRQMTWLRAERDVHWLDAARPVDELVQAIIAIASERGALAAPRGTDHPT
jgi:tRNA dimethylallyltransferase